MVKKGLPRWHSGKEYSCQCRRLRRYGFDPWVGKIPWSRKWQPTLVDLPGKFHGQKSTPRGHKELDMTEHAHAHNAKVSVVENDLRCERWAYKSIVGLPLYSPISILLRRVSKRISHRDQECLEGQESGIPTSMEYTVPGTASAEWVKERALLREPDVCPLQLTWADGKRRTRREKNEEPSLAPVQEVLRSHGCPVRGLPEDFRCAGRVAKMSLQCSKGLIPAFRSPQRHQWQSQFKL